jgi:hypothetical protein
VRYVLLTAALSSATTTSTIPFSNCTTYSIKALFRYVCKRMVALSGG